MPRKPDRPNLDRARTALIAMAFVASGCASTVVPGDGSGSEVISNGDALRGTDVLRASDGTNTVPVARRLS